MSHPHTGSPPPSENSPVSQKGSRIRQVISAITASFGIVICVVVAALAIAAGGGFFAGQRQRELNATATTVAEIDVQYQLGVLDLQAGQNEIAVQRFRWVIARAPNYPGAADGLAQAEAALGQTATPQSTLAPSAGQSAEALFAQARSLFDSQEWANAITRLQEVQAADPTYRSDEVKEMLYQSLVTLGLQYLRGDRLEEGLLLLQQAERIKALSDQAAGERNLARLYLTGRTYSGLNWNIAVNNYEAIYTIAPNYRDVKTRLHEAYLKLAAQTLAAGNSCDAAQLYQKAFDLKKDDPDVKATLDVVAVTCANATPTLPGGATITPGGPTLTPFPTSSTGAIPPGLIPPGTPHP